MTTEKPYINLARPWFGSEEIEAVVAAIKSGWWISGPRVEDFEREFATMMNVKHAVAVNSGSSALLICKLALGVGQGDEIIAPNMTFVSSASACMFLGAKPVFCDITLDDYGMDPNKLEKLISNKTKLIVPVHYAGQTANMAGIQTIADRHGIPILEDAAESHLAKFNGKFSGTIGKMGIFSFTPSKPMTTGEGGMVVTDDEELANKARAIRSFCDASKFEWQALGFNFRMPEVMGAIGREQLKRLPASIDQRREIAGRYDDAFGTLAGIVTPYVRHTEDHNFQLYTIRLELDKFDISRDQWIEKLHLEGVAARLYYPTLHNQGVFKDVCKQHDNDFPNTFAFAASAMSLPIYANLTANEQQTVIEAVKKIHEKHLV